MYVYIIKKKTYPILKYLQEPYIPLNYTISTPYYVKEKIPNLYFSNNNTLMLIEAVDDIRFNCIRILCALLEEYDKKIEVKINNNLVNYKLKYYGATRYENNDFSLKYANIITSFYPNITSIKVNEIEIPYFHINKVKYKYNFTVCISSIKNQFNATTILNQTINIYKKIGISHIILYFGDISKESYDIIKYYESTGFLEIHYWPQLIMLQYIRNFGQIIKMNDCFYRSYYNSKYIVNTDIDEIIVPKKYNQLSELISFYEHKYKKCQLFFFLNKIFPKKIGFIDNEIKINRNNYFNVSPITDCDIFNLTLSCKATDNSRKYIVSTKFIEAMRIHNVIGNDINHCYVYDKDGFSHHTRYISLKIINECKKLSHDYTILRYK